MLEHQQAVDRFLRAGRALAVAGHRLGGADRRGLALTEHPAHRFHFSDIPDRGRGAVGVDVGHFSIFGQSLQRQPHRPLAALAGGGDHVVTIRGGGKAGDLGVDLRTARLGMFEAFEHNDAAAAGDDEAVAVGVEGTARALGGVVILRAHRPHRVEQARQRPVEFFAAAGKHHVLLAHHDLLGGVADAMQRGRAGRGDRVVDALDLVGGGEVGRDRRTHALGHGEGADALGRAGIEHRLVRGEHGAGRGAAGAGDQTGADVGDGAFVQPRIGDRLLHRDIGIGGARPHEAQGALVDMILDVDLEIAGHPAAKAALGHFFVEIDPRLACLQRGQHLLGRIADGRDDPHPGDDDATHGVLLFGWDRV